MGNKSGDMNSHKKPEGALRVASLNVHQWVDARYSDNVGRVARLVHNLDVDVLCLQEVCKGPDLDKFMQYTKDRFGPYEVGPHGQAEAVVRQSGVAVFSRLPNKHYDFE